MQKESELFLLNVVIKVIRGADNSQSLSAPLVVFSLITYHFSLITSLQHAYTARRFLVKLQQSLYCLYLKCHKSYKF